MSEDAPGKRKSFAKPVLIVSAIVIFTAVSRWLFFSRTTIYPYDGYYYLILAKSLYTDLNYSVRGIPHSKFLPLFPLLTAAAYTFTPTIDMAAKLVVSISAAVSVWLTYLLGVRLADRTAGIAAAALLAVSPVFLKWSTLPMAEATFTAFFLLGVYFLVLAVERGESNFIFLGAACGGLSFVARYEGIIFFPLLIWALVAVGPKLKMSLKSSLVSVAVYSLPIAAYLTRNFLIIEQKTKISYMTEIRKYGAIEPALLVERARYYFLAPFLWNPAIAAIAYAGLAWMFLTRSQNFKPLAIWVGGFYFFHLCWYYVYERFMMPALPALFIFAGVLLSAAWERLGRLNGRATLQSCLLLAFALLLRLSWSQAVDVTGLHQKMLALDSQGKNFGNIAAAGRWIKKHVKAGRIATNSGLYGTFYSEKKTLYLVDYAFEPVDPANFEASQALEPQLKKAGIDVLLMIDGQHDPSKLYPDWSRIGQGEPRAKQLVFGNDPRSTPVRVIVLNR